MRQLFDNLKIGIGRIQNFSYAFNTGDYRLGLEIRGYHIFIFVSIKFKFKYNTKVPHERTAVGVYTALGAASLFAILFF